MQSVGMLRCSSCFRHASSPPRNVVGRRARAPHCQRRPRTAVNCHASDTRKKLVFLGTPDVAASVLQGLLEAAKLPGATFEVSMVVSQPGKPKGRGNKTVPVPSPVEQLARDAGFTDDRILCPAKARDAAFLSRLSELQPDLAVTAAYGNMLPQAFLDTPRLGTLNIHPSLLPLYRGAAPVQRALQDGVAETGVSVAYTVLACDAGPVLAQQRVGVDPDIQAPELLALLFKRGTALLLERLQDVFEGRGLQMAVPQDEAKVLHAAKLSREEAELDFHRCTSLQLHNRVRAFAGWPGTSAKLLLEDEGTGAQEPIEVKIVRTRAPLGTQGTSSTSTSSGGSDGASLPGAAEVRFEGDAMLLPCAGGTVLEVLQVQPPTKKAMPAKDFKNGLRKKKLMVPTAGVTAAASAVAAAARA